MEQNFTIFIEFVLLFSPNDEVNGSALAEKAKIEQLSVACTINIF